MQYNLNEIKLDFLLLAFEAQDRTDKKNSKKNMAAGFRVSPKYVGRVKLCVFDWAGKS